jgi:pyruvate, water dikinase
LTRLVLALADARDTAVAGGKGMGLGELTRVCALPPGFGVPPGFVVTTAAFAAALDWLDPAGSLAAGESPAALRARITAAPLPDRVTAAITQAYAALGPDTDVAVRSSATMEDSSAASFAGLQDSYLGVAGAPAVLGHVRRCWASLYNEESVAYRRRLGISEQDLRMAVVVQRMVRPRAAGVMFTRSPVTGDRSVVAIEGTWGLGSALVAGDVTPDNFVISKITGEITSRRVSPKARLHSLLPNGRGVSVTDTPADLRGRPCLSDSEIRALASVAGRVEAHYGAAQDIEWALIDSGTSLAAAPDSPTDRIVLLQSRPETVWAARSATSVAAPKPRPADHVLALFGKPL